MYALSHKFSIFQAVKFYNLDALVKNRISHKATPCCCHNAGAGEDHEDKNIRFQKLFSVSSVPPC